MATTNLGKVSLTPRGAYDPAERYEALDVVQHGGSSFLVLRPVQGVEPVVGEDYMLLAEKGDPATVCGKSADVNGNIALTMNDVGSEHYEVLIPQWDAFIAVLTSYWCVSGNPADVWAVVTSVDVLNDELLLRKDATGTKFSNLSEFIDGIGSGQLDLALTALDAASNAGDYLGYDEHPHVTLTPIELQYLLINHATVKTMPSEAEIKANTDYTWMYSRVASEWYVDRAEQRAKMLVDTSIRELEPQMPLAMAQSGGYTGTAADLCKDLASLQGLADALAAL